MKHLNVCAKEGISFMCFINCTLKESRVLQGTYVILVESMPGKYRKVCVFNFNYSVRMNTFCYTVCFTLQCCIYVQLNEQFYENHGIVII